MWNQEAPVDAGRYLLHQGGWENKSALERYNPAHEHEFGRVGGPYGGRSFPEAGFPRDSGYSRGGYQRDLLLEGDRFQMAPPLLGMWPPSRRTSLEDEFAVIRGPQRHAKVGYVDGYRDTDGYNKDVEYRDSDNFPDINHFREEKFQDTENFRELEKYRDYGYERVGRFAGADRHDLDDEFVHRRPSVRSREGSWDREHAHARYEEFDSDHEKDRRDRSRRKTRKREKERRRSRDREDSSEIERRRERSRSRGYDHWSRRSRSSSRGRTRDKRDRSYDEDLHDSQNDKKRVKDDKQQAVAPSATLVVKGLSQKTVEDDLYQALVDWGPLRHIRVIKERCTGVSRGFAFIDFPSVDAARKMMDVVGENGLVVDGRRLFFEYSSKPTGGLGGPQASPADSLLGLGANAFKGGGDAAIAVDWMCTVCGCVNFARRTSCFQCNEARADDAPLADLTSNPLTGKKGSEAGPTHVLVVRGLDENVNEELLHYEFSKYAPIKDLRLVRDKFTHISRGFAFVHFHSVEDATKSLESSNGTTLDKNGQPLRVAYAKSIHGPPSSSTASSSLAAAAIEAATFAQQYDVVAWAPKEYNPEQSSTSEVENGAAAGSSADANAAPQVGFVWDEASGYYYDAASGFYYDGHRGLYYDGNNGIWYTYNQTTQQYELFVEQVADSSAEAVGHKVNGKSAGKSSDGSFARRAVISAPPATIHNKELETPDTKLTAAEAFKAAAAAACVTTRKEKEKIKEREKELRLGCKNLLPSSKTKISGVSSMWRQKQPEGQAAVTDQSPLSANATSAEDKSKGPPSKITVNVAAAASTVTVSCATTSAASAKKIQGVIHTKQTLNKGLLDDTFFPDNKQKAFLATGAGTGMTPPMKKLEGIIRSKDLSGLNVQSSLGHGAGNLSSGSGDYSSSESFARARQSNSYALPTGGGLGANLSVVKAVEPGAKLEGLSTHQSSIMNSGTTPFKTDASALGAYSAAATPVGARRRFTEAPQSGYRDRAPGERRSPHGSSLSG